MQQGNRPTVFVSSTCYDLAQIRADLRQFLESMGMEPALSELHTFPINTDYDAITNCLENVKNRADLLILIVGGRYGSMVDSGRSITNMEFNEAKAKGIPIYVFIDRKIYRYYQVWTKNQEADFSAFVDNPALFNFIRDITDVVKHWSFQFDTAQDIITILKAQLANLFKNSLEARKLLKSVRSEFSDINVSQKAMLYLVHKPDCWVYLFIAQIFDDEVKKHRDIKNDLEFGVYIDECIVINDLLSTFEWIQNRFDNVQLLTTALAKLLNSALQRFLGGPGVKVDVNGIVYVAVRFGLAYRALLQWVIQFKRLRAHALFENVLAAISTAPIDICTRVEQFPEMMRSKVNEALTSDCDGPQHVEITLVMELPDTYLADVQREFQRVEEIIMHVFAQQAKGQ